MSFLDLAVTSSVKSAPPHHDPAVCIQAQSIAGPSSFWSI